MNILYDIEVDTATAKLIAKPTPTSPRGISFAASAIYVANHGYGNDSLVPMPNNTCYPI